MSAPSNPNRSNGNRASGVSFDTLSEILAHLTCERVMNHRALELIEKEERVAREFKESLGMKPRQCKGTSAPPGTDDPTGEFTDLLQPEMDARYATLPTNPNQERPDHAEY